MTELQGKRTILVVQGEKQGPSKRSGEREFDVFYTDDRAPTKIYSAKERLDCCCRSCSCLCTRDFDISVQNTEGVEVYNIHKQRICCSWFSCIPCCRHRMEVYRTSDKTRVGAAQSDGGCCARFPSFTTMDDRGGEGFKVTKDVNCCVRWCWCFPCCCEVPPGYVIRGRGQGAVNKIADLKAGQDTYKVVMPDGASDNDRILLLATSFLVDYALYEGPEKNADEMKEVKRDAKPM